MVYDIKDRRLTEKGKKRILWAAKDMPVLLSLRKEFARTKPFRGIRIGACLHVTTETANLMLTLRAGGAKVRLCASNPLSTQDDVAAALALEYGIETFAKKGEDNKTYFKHLNQVLDQKPHLTMDDGADLVSEIHKKRTNLIRAVVGGTEETTTGVIRLKAMAKSGALRFPILAVNEAQTKHFFDNRYGTGQSTIDGIIRATNVLLAGTTFVVAGYGWCGKGVAKRADGLGARVIVTEINSVRALEAMMDGFRVMPMKEAAKRADIICTLTGNRDVLDTPHFEAMKDGCIIANSGHFDVEINLKSLQKLATLTSSPRTLVDEYTFPPLRRAGKNGKRIFVLGEGRLVNLAMAEGHPASVMDMSFANQALGAKFILDNRGKLENKVYVIPEAVDRAIAERKLRALGVKIDTLTPAQAKYLESWEEGTS
ncbi:MAG: adenosylhomocysteinase [Candidatus Taylorbacteria bacterium RIFCSPHIGHO2_02_49_25]|uniref:Adenosylhomocysteinase n=1 Tax=Candidatus Taylorbacteria bacterium RIFCSPHIGHO2_02_49_25 TaxID=1802305 RepID=A0A1G2MJA1_9BACT|nr:MAG: adenosylhomocysteinase [Candidatus Taylorbacteria bacterium RIFCSPHIGHO2_01_FULL_49_60]OHA23239.1 MAG: adenosylhomocysteinase [Candidatus Taylorbacteria bacterium RIFCSPHIGHO2_02_49_25]OHA35549.1 MAG: adenosylhomocysteinase [Candidatus Taylorbacteria bacterium RIFCSPLOWO2_02_50_13]OHA46353.1 MAG: adenosylhomocysteinase [Candidatus Taylorbacteria bacterium RIFCSPLOWO2_12_FULL_49_67]HCB35029.1 adenosylhomocysteinase [Candidatus Taylorbacteria bacterium]